MVPQLHSGGQITCKIRFWKLFQVRKYMLMTISDVRGEGSTNPPPPVAGINVETLQEIEIIDQDEDDNDSVSAIVSHPFR